MSEYEYMPKEKSRVQQINENLLSNIKTIYRLRKVQQDIVDNKPHYAYVISLAKSHPLSLEEQVLSVYNHLKSILLSDETLITDNKCLKIISNLYAVEFCIEAWRKSADKLAYIQDGEVMIELLHRMSCEQAAYIFKKHRIEPFELLNTLETLQKYKNPADKYSALAKMPILLKKYIEKVRKMNLLENFDGHDLINMMFDSESIDMFKSLWDKDKGLEKWSELLHMCYWELSYERVGGDEGYLDNPPINVERIKYLEELIEFLEKLGVRAINDAPQTK